ncbi:MAG: hypothetical protein IKN17_01000 [Ruminococcus sp.]|nr:hypothetical protein [Ruminococcus sp.]
MRSLLRTTMRTHLFSPLSLLAAAAAVFIGCSFGLSFEAVIDQQENCIYIHEFSCLAHTVVMFLPAILIPVHTCREFSHGTVRNKLICGVTKTRFLLSEILVNMLTAALLFALVTVPIVIRGEAMLAEKEWLLLARMFLTMLGGYLLCAVIMTVLCCCIFCSYRALAVVACTLLLVVCIVGGLRLQRLLWSPRLYERNEYGTDNYVTVEDPAYIGGAARTLMKTAIFCDPFMQVYISVYEYFPLTGGYDDSYFDDLKKDLDHSTFDVEEQVYYPCFPLYQAGTALVFTAAGILILRRRNIR